MTNAKKTTKQATAETRIVDDLGVVCDELYAPHGAVRYAHARLTKLGHIAYWQGSFAECSKCGKSAHLLAAHPKGWTLEGSALRACGA